MQFCISAGWSCLKSSTDSALRRPELRPLLPFVEQRVQEVRKQTIQVAQTLIYIHKHNYTIYMNKKNYNIRAS